MDMLSSVILSHNHVSEKHNKHEFLNSFAYLTLAHSSSKFRFRPFGLIERTFAKMTVGRGNCLMFCLCRLLTPPLLPLLCLSFLLVWRQLLSFNCPSVIFRQVNLLQSLINSLKTDFVKSARRHESTYTLCCLCHCTYCIISANNTAT